MAVESGCCSGGGGDDFEGVGGASGVLGVLEDGVLVVLGRSSENSTGVW